MSLLRPLTGALVVLLLLALPVAALASDPVEYGDHGAHVRTLQKALHLHTDGEFGKGTLHALKKFQKDHHLDVDGIPGPAFWAAIKRESKAKSGGSGSSSARAIAVRVLQRRLHVTPDGVFGPGTAKAVKRFQKGHGLTPDGVVGPATWKALGVSGQPVVKQASTHSSSVVGGGMSDRVHRGIMAGNRIAHYPYRYGGGHGSFRDSGYDCSGSISYVLHSMRALDIPLDSSGFMHYGGAGKGRYVTIYANSGHAFMVINGRRYDTSGMDDGTRWDRRSVDTSSYAVRHPYGL